MKNVVKAMGTGIGVGIVIVLLCTIITMPAICADYNIHRLFAADIPWYLDWLAGVVTAPVNVPMAVVLKVLEVADVYTATPMFKAGG